MNPCPCGYFGDPNKPCNCNPDQIERYLGRISGPLIDRIDIHVEVSGAPYRESQRPRRGETVEACLRTSSFNQLAVFTPRMPPTRDTNAPGPLLRVPECVGMCPKEAITLERGGICWSKGKSIIIVFPLEGDQTEQVPDSDEPLSGGRVASRKYGKDDERAAGTIAIPSCAQPTSSGEKRSRCPTSTAGLMLIQASTGGAGQYAFSPAVSMSNRGSRSRSPATTRNLQSAILPPSLRFGLWTFRLFPFSAFRFREVWVRLALHVFSDVFQPGLCSTRSSIVSTCQAIGPSIVPSSALRVVDTIAHNYSLSPKA